MKIIKKTFVVISCIIFLLAFSNIDLNSQTLEREDAQQVMQTIIDQPKINKLIDENTPLSIDGKLILILENDFIPRDILLFFKGKKIGFGRMEDFFQIGGTRIRLVECEKENKSVSIKIIVSPETREYYIYNAYFSLENGDWILTKDQIKVEKR